MNEMIQLENVIKMYESGIRAVNGADISITEGECVNITGALGSGKTTLLRLIAGIDSPSDGHVYVMDESVHEMDADTAANFRNRYIGILQSEPHFMGTMTVMENISLPLMICGISTSEREKAAKEQLDMLGITYAAHAHPQQLSKDEAKLVSIARALVSQPKILLLDDMLAGLSARGTEKITNILKTIRKFSNYTIVVFSVKECLWAERRFEMDFGKIQEVIQ